MHGEEGKEGEKKEGKQTSGRGRAKRGQSEPGDWWCGCLPSALAWRAAVRRGGEEGGPLGHLGAWQPVRDRWLVVIDDLHDTRMSWDQCDGANFGSIRAAN